MADASQSPTRSARRHVAFEASTGPRVLPGTYTVKLTRGQETYTTSIEIGLDARARYTLEDRKLQFAVLTRLSNLLGDMSFEVERVNRVRDALLDRAGKLDAGDFLRQQLADLAPSADKIRQKIVATKEGGAITGELRIREKTTELYGEILGYEGRPTDYQVTRFESLQHELADVSSEFDSFLAQHLSSVNKSLATKHQVTIQPITRADWEKSLRESDSQ